MGLFSRKKQPPSGPLPPVPRFPAPGQAQPRYEPEFPQSQDNRPQEHRISEFPDIHPEPVNIPPPPATSSFPRPAHDEQQVHPAYARPIDERLPTHQEPIARPQPVVMPHPEAVRAQPPAQSYSMAHPEIPVREPSFTRKPVEYPTRAAVAENKAFPWQREPQVIQRPQIPDRPLPSPMAHPQPVMRSPVSFERSATPPITHPQPTTMSVEDKPVFIKIGQYREAMSSLELLKQKIKDAEQALAKIEDLRAKEQQEITNARTMLTTVKDKLMTIDKKLFDV